MGWPVFEAQLFLESKVTVGLWQGLETSRLHFGGGRSLKKDSVKAAK